MRQQENHKTGVFHALLLHYSENNAQPYVNRISDKFHFAYQYPIKRKTIKNTAATMQATTTGLSVLSIMLPPASIE
jgi:hypothetical protein